MLIKRKIYFILTLIMMIVIFGFSSQESKKSNNLSYSIDIKIFNLINKETESTSNVKVANATSEASDETSNESVHEEKQESNANNEQEEIQDLNSNEKQEETEYPVNNKLFHNIDTAVRKTAHVILYTLFSIFLTLFVKTYGIKNWKTICIVIVVRIFVCLFR